MSDASYKDTMSMSDASYKVKLYKCICSMQVIKTSYIKLYKCICPMQVIKTSYINVYVRCKL